MQRDNNTHHSRNNTLRGTVQQIFLLPIASTTTDTINKKKMLGLAADLDNSVLHLTEHDRRSLTWIGTEYFVLPSVQLTTL